VPRDLRSFARGKACYLRLPGLCSNPESVVLAHVRRGGVAGTGQKPCDAAALPMCHLCHSAYDQRIRTEYSREQLDAEALRGLVQWLDYLWRNEYLIAVVAA
jgi:hypothetical protein